MPANCGLTISCRFAQGDLGGLLIDEGRYAEAAEAFRKVLRDRLALHGEVYDLTLSAYLNLGKALTLQGLEDQAEANYRKAEALCTLLPQTLPYVPRLYQRLAELHTARGDLASAEEYIRRGLKIYTAAGVEDSIVGLQYQLLLITCLEKQGKHSKAAQRQHVVMQMLAQFWVDCASAILGCRQLETHRGLGVFACKLRLVEKRLQELREE
jgi:tetratricopeptide (TPR) repeat protein